MALEAKASNPIIRLTNNPYVITERHHINREKTKFDIKEDCLIYDIHINGKPIEINRSYKNWNENFDSDDSEFSLDKFDVLEYTIETSTRIRSDITKIISSYVHNEVDIISFTKDRTLFVNNDIYYLFKIRKQPKRHCMIIYNYREQNIILEYKKVCPAYNHISATETQLLDVNYFYYKDDYYIDKYGWIYKKFGMCNDSNIFKLVYQS